MKQKELSKNSHFPNDEIAANVGKIVELIGENPNRQGLLGTPRRSAEVWEYLTSGYRQTLEELLNNAVFDSDMDEMVIVKNTELFSLCEHHLLPFIGKCHVAYLPRGKIIGLSKVARIIDMFARRLQIQEQLTQQIAQTILQATNAKGVGVVIEAQHLCLTMRGVAKQNSVMTTSVMLGKFREDERTRAEFLNLIS